MTDQTAKRFSWFGKGFIHSRRKTQRIAGKSGIIPPLLLQDNRVPQFFRDAIIHCGADGVNKLPQTSEVLSLMWRSGLPESILAAIWNTVGITSNDYVTREEFYSCLVLIALAQKNLTITDLGTMPSLPIPNLSSLKPNSSRVKAFKTDERLQQPNGHLFKTVDPLFTDTATRTPEDLINFDSNAEGKEKSPADLDLTATTGNISRAPLSRDAIPIFERIIRAAAEVFEPLRQTNEQMIDALRTEKGFVYLLALHQIERIIYKVRCSLSEFENYPPGLIVKCDVIMEQFRNVRNVVETDEFRIQFAQEMELTDYICSLCGRHTNADNTHFDATTELSFHVRCANFWINLVEPTLPLTPRGH